MPARKDMDPPEDAPTRKERDAEEPQQAEREEAEPAVRAAARRRDAASAREADPAPADADGPAPRGDSRADDAVPLGARRDEYLIVPRSILPMGTAPADIAAVENQLRSAPGVQVVRSIDLAGVSWMSTAMPAPERALVALMPQDTAEIVAGRSATNLIVERNERMQHARDDSPFPAAFDPGITVPLGSGFQASFVVTGGPGGVPVAGAQVMIVGTTQTAQAVTDANGQAVVSIAGEDPETVRGLFVQPAADFWNLWLPRPGIRTDRANRVGLTPLAGLGNGAGAPFPDRQVLGWGQRAMRLDQVPADRRGRGVKVAIIDSGLAPAHRDLDHIRHGINIVTGDPAGWRTDEIGHGSHCAGIIAARDDAREIRGFVPDAEIHIIKYFPGGTFAHLVDALAYCIRNQIDVVNLSLGSRSPSEAVEEMLVRAKDAGVCCIVAAGNIPGGGPVMFPGTSPSVLTVAAIGKTGEFPADSWHANEVLTGADGAPAATPEGYFSTRFTCFGNEVDLCAPGHAVVSCVPPDNYAAKDGTSMAAPHVTGLAALIVAHHPDFQGSGAFRMPSAARVNRVFEILKQSARPISLGSVQRSGAGMPDTATALNLSAGTGASQSPPAQQNDLLRFLELLLGSLRQQAGAAPQAAPAPAGDRAAARGMSEPAGGLAAAMGPERGR